MIRNFFAALLLAAACIPTALAGALLGAAALKSQHTTLAPRLASNDFGGPLLLQSVETRTRIEGEVYAVLDHPFATVSAALGDPARWCDIMILHLNTKGCQRTQDGTITRILLRVGKKEPQPPEDAALLNFHWEAAPRRPDYLSAELHCDDGPYDTRDYKMFVEAVPIDDSHTFIHMGYAFSYGGGSSIAMKLYLGTVGRNKVGFTKDGDRFVTGVRGIAERNTMRYYLAIDAYLDSLAAPKEQQVEKRIAQWFDATEKYARQLHEVDRAAYIPMKREEIRRMAAKAG